MLLMAYPSFHTNEPEFQAILSWRNHEYDVSLPDGDHLPSDGTLYGCPFFNSSGYHQEGLLHAIISSPCMQEDEPFFASSLWDKTSDSEEAYEEENWLRQCNSIFSCSWQNNYGSPQNEISNNLEKMECSNSSEEQHESCSSCEDEDTENYSAASYYDPWSFCDSWLGYGDKKTSTDYSHEEDGIMYEQGMREVAVYEGIFGYWPCLYPRNSRRHCTLQEW